MEGESVIDVVVGGLAGMVPIVGGFTGPIGEKLSRAMRESWSRNISEALKAAERLTGFDRDTLGKLIAEDQNLISLYSRVLYAAGMNGHDQTLRAIGTLLGTAIKDSPERSFESFIDIEAMLKSIEGLSPAHFLILEALDSHKIPNDNGVTGMEQQPSESIAKFLKMDHEKTEFCLVNLSSSGLVITNSGYNALVHRVSNAGHALLLASKEISDD